MALFTKNCFLAIFGGHLDSCVKPKNRIYFRNCEIERFLQNFWPAGYKQSHLSLFAKDCFPAILNFCEIRKSAYISETVRDRAISAKFLATFASNHFPAIFGGHI